MTKGFIFGGASLALLVTAGGLSGLVRPALRNPGFENGVSPWSVNAPAPSKITRIGQEGKHALRIEMPFGTRLPNVHQRLVDLEPGATYRLSAQVRGVKGLPLTSAKVKLEFYSLLGHNTSGHSEVQEAPAGEGWRSIAVTARADRDAVLADLIVGVSGPGVLEIDNVRFEMLAPAPALRLEPLGGPMVLESGQTGSASWLATFKQPQAESLAWEVRIGKEERPVPLSATRIDSRNWRMEAKIPPLPPGSHRAVATQGSFTAEAEFFVNPQDRKPARLDARGNHLWQGEPFFPIGIYHVAHNAEEYAMLAAHGFNMIQGVFPGNLDDFMRSLDLALNHGIAVDVPLYISGNVKENTARSIEIIRRAGNHPAVLCWKIFDEPDADQHTAKRAEIPLAYVALKAIKPRQPLELTLCQDEPLAYWLNFCDAAQIDRYPLPGGALMEVYEACRKASAAARPWQALTAVLQCGWTSDLATQPSAAQARALVYLALLGGARGISWYSRSDPGWDLTQTPLWPHLKEINREIRSLSQPLLKGGELTGIASDAKGVVVRGFLYNDRLYLMMCNPEEKGVSARISIPAPPAGGRWRVLPGEIDSGRLRVDLGPIDSQTRVLEREGGRP